MNDAIRIPLLVQEAREYYQALLRPVFVGRKFLHAGGVAVGLGDQARTLAALGTARPFLLADSEGTGEMPTEDEAELRLLGVRGTDIVDQQRQSEQALANLPPEVKAAIDVWDPEGDARWLCSGILLGEMSTVAGRRKYALREPPWTALEDKVAIDAFWDAVQVRRAPSRIVAAEHQALQAAARDLDRGRGTVWAADARDGVHGGTVGVRWVRPEDDGATASASLAKIADRVRVMPFLEGIPASIHGIVFPDAVAVFRPVEMVILRPTTGDRFLYAGCSTWFDPAPQDRDAMRTVAWRVGAALRERVGYRGAFTVDGVLAEEGFLPTELNPRLGGGIYTLSRGLGDFPLLPLCWAVVEGEPVDYRPDLLERAVLAAADACRAGGGQTVASREFTKTETLDLLRDGDEYRRAGPGDVATATLSFGPGTIGGFLRFTLNPESNEPGHPSAPEVVRALRFADRHLGTDFGPLEAAKNLRPVRETLQ